MKTFISICLLSLFIFSSVVSAQEQKNTVGVGFSLGTTGTTGYTFYVPITLDRVRIEPLFGFQTTSSHSTSDWTTTYSTRTTTSSSTSDNSGHTVSIGTGLYYTFHIDEKILYHIGPRGGVSFASSTSDRIHTYTDTTYSQVTNDHTKQSSVNYFVGVAGGAEYYFARYFSIGGELFLNYAHSGIPVIEQTQTVTPPNKYTSTSTPTLNSSNAISGGSAIFFRWYF